MAAWNEEERTARMWEKEYQDYVPDPEYRLRDAVVRRPIPNPSLKGRELEAELELKELAVDVTIGLLKLGLVVILGLGVVVMMALVWEVGLLVF